MNAVSERSETGEAVIPLDASPAASLQPWDRHAFRAVVASPSTLQWPGMWYPATKAI